MGKEGAVKKRDYMLGDEEDWVDDCVGVLVEYKETRKGF